MFNEDAFRILEYSKRCGIKAKTETQIIKIGTSKAEVPRV